VWCQMMADVTGMVIQQPQAPIQANALGAAFIAGVGLGELSFHDIRALSQNQRQFEPDSTKRSIYDDCFGTFKELHKRLAPLYRSLNQDRNPPR
jgi:xylulokinase